MTPFKTNAALVLLSAAALAGCVQTTPHWDQHFGENERMMMAQQVLNPDAGTKALPESMEGGAARETVIRYRSTFKEPPPPQNVFTIGVGGSGGSR
ncbi:MAG: hypothetical protein RL404_147 [Pseudomonadota bacterium]|jgi:hypothetical protein